MGLTFAPRKNILKKLEYNSIWGADWLRGIGSDPLPDADNAAVGSIGIGNDREKSPDGLLTAYVWESLRGCRDNQVSGVFLF